MVKMSKSESGKLGSVASRESHNRLRLQRIEVYNNKPNRCQNANCSSIELPYEKRHNKFCSQSCAATHNNSIKPKQLLIRKQVTQSKYKVNDPSRPAKVTFSCLNCHKEVQAHLHRQVKFCSNTCQGEWRIKQSNLEVESGTCKNSGKVKRYLLVTYGDRCMDPDCAWDFNKRHVKVELEHIDGNSSNNQLSNVKLLCPSCHSLTPTYKAKNKGNGRHSRRERYQEGKSY